MRTAPIPCNRRPRAIVVAANADAARRVTVVRWLAVLTALALLAAAAAPARAQVRDQANVFSPEAEQKAQQAIDQIQQKHKRRLLIESYASVPAEKRGELQSKGVKQFYHDWTLERANAERVDGVVVLLGLDPRQMRIQVLGAETQRRLFTASDVAEMEKPALQSLTNKQYDEFLTRMASFVQNRMDYNSTRPGAAAAPPAAGGTGGGSGAGAGGPTPTGSKPKTGCGIGGVGGVGGFLCLAVGGLVVFMVIRGVMNRSRAAYGPGGMAGPGYGPGYGQPGYGQPGYGQPGYGGGGGGFGSGLLGGLLGGAVGGYAANKIFGQNNPTAGAPPADAGGGAADTGHSAGDVGGGGDFGGGSDFGGGGDFGGGDSGGGDVGGGGDF